MKRAILITLGIIAIAVIIGFFRLYNETFGDFWITEKILDEKLESQQKTFKIGIDKEARFPHSIDLVLKGKLNGIAVLSYSWVDTLSYQIDTVKGEFNIDYRSDWYSDTCFISYKPLTATNGEIKIDCKIYSSKK